MRLRDSEVSIVEDDERLCEELNSKFKNVFTVRWNGKDVLEIVRCLAKMLTGYYMDLTPTRLMLIMKFHVLKSCTNTLHRTHCITVQDVIGEKHSAKGMEEGKYFCI